jgi:tetratricopeptide (TPR) repeat protein
MAQVAATFQRAIAFHQKGELARARAAYEEILKVDPQHFDSLHLLGVIAAQTDNPSKAIELIGKAVAVAANNPAAYAAYGNLGSAHVDLKNLEAALVNFSKAIALNPDFAAAYYGRGNVQRAYKQFDAALSSYNRAIALSPGLAEAYSCRGLVLCELKQFAAAMADYDKAIALRPHYAEAYFNRGALFAQLKQSDAAILSYHRALAIRPDLAQAHYSVGNVFVELQQFDAALAAYNKAIAVKVDYAEAYMHRGNVLAELGQFDAALASHDRAIVLAADSAEPYYNRANLLVQLNQLEAASADYQRAIAIRPDFVEAHLNRGNTFLALSQLPAAFASYEDAIAIKADYAEAQHHRAVAQLLNGDFSNGWRNYEWRWKLDDTSINKEKRHFRQAVWLGQESIAGKTVLLHGEQGLGDRLQFCRYVRMVAELGARVILETPSPLANLLVNLEGLSQLVATGSPLPAFDYHCPLMSLPLAFNTRLDTIPHSARYLRGDAAKVARWRAKLGEGNRPRIGLAWSGSTAHKHDHKRSIALRELLRFLPPDFQYISLQKELREADRNTLKSSSLLNFSEELNDFSDTAALCECLDLIISVDTSAVHLSAALGKRTWVLLPFSPDWRWLLDRSDSPWYPTVKLFRQAKIGEWDRVLEQIKAGLSREFG